MANALTPEQLRAMNDKNEIKKLIETVQSDKFKGFSPSVQIEMVRKFIKRF